MGRNLLKRVPEMFLRNGNRGENKDVYRKVAILDFTNVSRLRPYAMILKSFCMCFLLNLMEVMSVLYLALLTVLCMLCKTYVINC